MLVLTQAANRPKALAEQLVNVLPAQRDLGGEAYAVARDRLLALTDTSAEPALAEKAFAVKVFEDQAVRRKVVWNLGACIKVPDAFSSLTPSLLRVLGLRGGARRGSVDATAGAGPGAGTGKGTHTVAGAAGGQRSDT